MSLVLFRRPAAWIPLAMSLTALAMVIAVVVRYGPVPDADEGAAAHLFQLLIAGQLPFLAWIALRWLPRQLRPAAAVLAAQAVAILAACAPVYYFHL